jgi:hypothetical protein
MLTVRFCVSSIVCGAGMTHSLIGVEGNLGLIYFTGRDFLFFTVSRSAVGFTNPAIWWVPMTCFAGMKRQKRELDHSPSSKVKVKNAFPIRVQVEVLD